MKEIDFADLQSLDPKIKYGCCKEILTVAKANPSALYSHLDYFVGLLDSDNRIFRWTVIDVIGYLSGVDKSNRIDKLIEKLFAFLDQGNMITANHAISSLTNIAQAKPEYRERITEELLKVEHYRYDTNECRNIALGKVILAVGSCFDRLEDKKKVAGFVKRQITNPRNATRKKAEQFLKKYNIN